MNFFQLGKKVKDILVNASAWGIVLIAGLLFFGAFLFYRKEKALLHRLHNLEASWEKKSKAQPATIIKNVHQERWLDVQKKAHNTVVQIFAQTTHFNWIEPYKTPQQGESSGSGFFINEDGHMITNYHVIDDASTLQVQIPSLGKEQFEAEVIGVCPDRDIALIKLTSGALKEVKNRLGTIPFLKLGDSDLIRKTHEILALGYPLGLQIVKSTQGIVSGQEWISGKSYIQITAPLNPGNSGGPALNIEGEVIGINTAGFPNAQNVGFVIPINQVKSTINDLYKIKFLRKPLLGCIFTPATPELVKFLGNPLPGGWYIARVFPESTIEKAGVKEKDMLYTLNDHVVDRFGEISVEWSEDKVPAVALFDRFVVGDTVELGMYRYGIFKHISLCLESRSIAPIRQVYPLFEKVDYEIIGGMVVMELTINHILLMLERAPFLMNFTKPENQTETRLVVTHVLPTSLTYKQRLLSPGALLEEINGITVRTLDDFRKAFVKPEKNEFLTVRYIDRAHDDMFLVLPFNKLLEEEDVLSARYFYKKSALIEQVKELKKGKVHEEKTAA